MSLEDLGVLFVGVDFAWFCCSPSRVCTGGSGVSLAKIMVEEACSSRVMHQKFVVEKSWVGLQKSGKLTSHVFPSLDFSRRRWLFQNKQQELLESPGRRAWRVRRVILRGGLKLKFDFTGVPDRLAGNGKTENQLYELCSHLSRIAHNLQLFL